MLAMPVAAQKRKNVPRKAAKPSVVKESPADRLYNSMLPATAKVMIIDSTVVDKDGFLSKVPLNKESGSIMSHEAFFHKNQQPGTSVYLNEFRNSCYFAEGDSVQGTSIYAMNLLGDKWSEPESLEGIGDEFAGQNYPFMMADGITLFFAAKGEKSIGGYDIFMTLFDRDSGRFYTPENYGLPFNSRANDYLIAFDDLDTLGWFVSDRYQPEGKVCIYTFVPTNPRQNFDGDNLSEKQLRQLADVASIKDTWAWGDRDKAMERLKKMIERNSRRNDAEDISFVINDNVTYHNLGEFRSSGNRQRFITLKQDKTALLREERELGELRNRYAASSDSVKAELKQDILRKEEEIEKNRLQIRQQEKELRNAENMLLTK